MPVVGGRQGDDSTAIKALSPLLGLLNIADSGMSGTTMDTVATYWVTTLVSVGLSCSAV